MKFFPVQKRPVTESVNILTYCQNFDALIVLLYQGILCLTSPLYENA